MSEWTEDRHVRFKEQAEFNLKELEKYIGMVGTPERCGDILAQREAWQNVRDALAELDRLCFDNAALRVRVSELEKELNREENV